jgi:hypothetical protein
MNRRLQLISATAIFLLCVTVISLSQDLQTPHKDRLAWLAKQAKGRGDSVVRLSPPIVEYEGSNLDLPETMDYFDVVLVTVKEARVIADTDRIKTWYRIHVLETLHHTSTSQQNAQIEIPVQLPELGSNELWIARPGGSLVLDGVELVEPVTAPFDIGAKYLLFIARSANGVAGTAGGHQGMFKVDEAGRLKPLSREPHRLRYAVEISSGNSLDRLRDVIRRIEH